MKTELKDTLAILNFTISIISASIFYWIIPYSEINMTGLSFILTWSITGFLVGGAGVGILKKSRLHAALLTTTGFITSVLIRMIFEFTIDSTTHNLFPFEIMITMLIAFPSSFLGAFSASLLIRKSNQQ